jgi:hypothetical protein
MASSANTIDTLNGMFKEVYADKIENLIPDGVKLYNMIPFNKESKALGNLYHQPVVLGLEHGVSYGGSGGNAFSLNSSIAGVMQDAQVQGYEMVLRSVLSVGAASRSIASSGSFEKATKHLVANMLRSISRRLEVQLLYGKRSIGRVSGAPSGQVITISDATWAPGIWSGAEGMLVDFYDDLPDNSGAIQLANAEISSVDFDNKQITLVSGAASVQDGDYIFYKGSFGNEFDGVDQIIRNTGTLFNISASSYNLWQGNVLGNSGATRDLSFQLISEAVTRLVEKGLADQDVVVLINPKQFDVLLAEQDAKRMYDSSYSKDSAHAGSKEIMFHSQNGSIKIISSIYVKAGSAYVLCLDEFLRVGSSDITFKQPGFEGEFFRILNDSNGYELRAYTDQALFCSAPGKNAVIDDLTVS